MVVLFLQDMVQSIRISMKINKFNLTNVNSPTFVGFFVYEIMGIFDYGQVYITNTIYWVGFLGM